MPDKGPAIGRLKLLWPEIVGEQLAKGTSKGRTERLQWLRSRFSVRKSQSGLEAAKKWLGKQAGIAKLKF